MKPDSLSFLTLITKLQSHSAFCIGRLAFCKIPLRHSMSSPEPSLLLFSGTGIACPESVKELNFWNEIKAHQIYLPCLLHHCNASVGNIYFSCSPYRTWPRWWRAFNFEITFSRKLYRWAGYVWGSQYKAYTERINSMPYNSQMQMPSTDFLLSRSL